MRVVLDTNVLVAAFAARGLCEDVLRTVLAEHELVISDRILGDPDLQNAPPDIPVEVLSPREFWARLKQGNAPS